MRSSRFAFVLVLAFATWFTGRSAAAQTFDQTSWDALLKASVKGGRVDYAALKSDARLAQHVERLAAFDPATLPTREARLAFWINAYNALAIHGVLRHWPGLKSVQDPYPDFGFFKRPDFRVGGRTLSLDQIEHEIVRKTFAEPRIHAALNCASVSCPSLRAEAYRAEVLDRQLDEQMRAFVNDPSRNRIDAASGEVALSSLFDWFNGDFGDLTVFLGRYLDPPKQAAVKAAVAAGRVKFLPYDWALNAR